MIKKIISTILMLAMLAPSMPSGAAGMFTEDDNFGVPVEFTMIMRIRKAHMSLSPKTRYQSKRTKPMRRLRRLNMPQNQHLRLKCGSLRAECRITVIRYVLNRNAAMNILMRNSRTDRTTGG